MKKRGLPLRIHLMLIAVVAFIFPVIIAGSVLYVQIAQQLDKNIQQNLTEQAELISLMVKQDYYEAQNKASGSSNGKNYYYQIYQSNLMDYLQKVDIGKNGYVFILDSSGSYVLSEDRRRDGESIMGAQDDSGRYFIKEMVEQAQKLRSGETGTIRYPWRNSEAEPLQEKMAVYTYFEPWDWVIGVSAVMADFRSSTVFIRNLTLIIGAAFILIAVLVAVLVGRAYANPIEHLEGAVKEIGAGDLTRKVALKSSIREINSLSEDFDNNLIVSMRTMLASIKDMINSSLETSEEISNQVEGTLVFTNQMSEELATMRNQLYSLDGRINEASSAAEQIDATIKSVSGQISNQSSSVTQTSAAIEEMNSSIQSVARITEDRRQAGEELAQITGKGGQKVAQTNDIIQEIGVSIQDMMDMITVINKVAAQTNLLAMNAAIEAAHAGDAGRGFAVVAEEIRNLSTSTSESAKKISSRLKGIVDRIQQATEISAETGQTFEEVNREVNNFVQAFSEIASSAGELSTGSEEMLHAVSTLQDVTQEIQSGSDEMTSGVSDISENLQSLRDFSKETVNHLKTLTDKTQSVNYAQSNMTDMVIRNTKNAAELAGEIEQFKIDEQSEAGEGESDTGEVNTLASSQQSQFTIGALVLQEWAVRLRTWISNENRSEHVPDLAKTLLESWIEKGETTRLAGFENFRTFREQYRQLRELTQTIEKSIAEGNSDSAEQQYDMVVAAVKKAKSAIRSLGYDLTSE